MSKKVKLKHIAEPLGLSVATVYRALNNVNGVNSKTRDMILEKARELGHDIDTDTEFVKKMKKSNAKMNISVLCPNDFFYEAVIKGMKSAIQQPQYHNVNLDFKFQQVHDVSVQSEQLREIVKEDFFDAVLISPAHQLLLNPLFDELCAKGKIVITFTSDASASKRHCYIGQNSLVAGKMAAEILNMKINKGTDIAVLKSFSSVSCVIERESGFMNYMAQYNPEVKIHGPFEYFDTIENAKSIAEQVILNNPNTGGLFANNMAGTIGCARAVKETGNAGKIFVAGFDDNSEIREFIDEGIIISTLLQDPYYQGYTAVRTAYRLLTSELKSAKTFMHTRCDMLMKSNLEMFVND